MAGFMRKTTATFDPNKPFAWSYSKLKNHESCPKRHYHVDIVKDWQEAESQALAYGNDLHEKLARAIGDYGGNKPDGSDAVPLPDSYKEMEILVQQRQARRTKMNARVMTELSLAMSSDFKPAPWFEDRRDATKPKPWYRAKVDVLTLLGPVAIAEDWKTGKITEDNPQLRMTAMLIFAHHPQVQKVRTTFFWLKEDAETVEDVTREQQMSMWADIAPRVEKLRIAYQTPDPAVGFPAKPGYLCRKWCPVKTCPHYGT